MKQRWSGRPSAFALALALALVLALVAAALLVPGLSPLFSTAGFMPHGHCYLWDPSVVWLHVASDALIGVSYVTISSLLVRFVRRRHDLPFDWMFIAFGLFIIACGVGHFIDVLTLWYPAYWLSGLERGFTALVSVLTALLLMPMIPKALALPSPEQLRVANAQLQDEVKERRLAEARLARKAEELELALRRLEEQQEALVRAEKLATVGQLAASVGHELRNPLAAVQNALTYLSKRTLVPEGAAPPPPDARVREFFGLAERELKACGKIITDLLDFARDRKPALQPCPLRPLVDEALQVVPGAAARVENLVPAGLPMPNLDRDQFRQVVINLVQNALDASPAEAARPVKVEATGGGEAPWKLVVVDDGRGVPDDLRAKIFEPLFTTKVKGTGLGLAIVQSIVRAHGGDVAVANREGAGAAFTITLPPADAAPAAEGA